MWKNILFVGIFWGCFVKLLGLQTPKGGNKGRRPKMTDSPWMMDLSLAALFRWSGQRRPSSASSWGRRRYGRRPTEWWWRAGRRTPRRSRWQSRGWRWSTPWGRLIQSENTIISWKLETKQDNDRDHLQLISNLRERATFKKWAPWLALIYIQQPRGLRCSLKEANATQRKIDVTIIVQEIRDMRSFDVIIIVHRTIIQSSFIHMY